MRRLPFAPAPIVAFALVASACVPRVAPPPTPAPEPTPTTQLSPALPLARDWRDWPVTPGDWVYRQDPRGSVALFGPKGADAAMVLRCDTARRTIFLSLSGSEAGPITVRTSSLTRAVTLAPTGGEQPYLAAALVPNDPLLDAMGFSRGRFAIERPGASPLVVPAWPEIERVTQDCRS